MKKLLAVLLTVVSAICLSLAFTGCGNDKITVRGKYYTLKQAYDNGWLDGDDLKNIAYYYYDYYNIENPNGATQPKEIEELSEELQKELKQAYLDEYDISDLSIDGVEILNYGTYNGNAVVRVRSDYILFDVIIEPEFEIGGVVFLNFWQGDILVYHIG